MQCGEKFSGSQLHLGTYEMENGRQAPLTTKHLIQTAKPETVARGLTAIDRHICGGGFPL